MGRCAKQPVFNKLFRAFALRRTRLVNEIRKPAPPRPAPPRPAPPRSSHEEASGPGGFYCLRASIVCAAASYNIVGSLEEVFTGYNNILHLDAVSNFIQTATSAFCAGRPEGGAKFFAWWPDACTCGRAQCSCTLYLNTQ
jgi:hypothetical protein